MPRKSKGIIMYLAMFGLLIVLLFAMMSMDKPVSTMKYYEVLDYFKQGKVHLLVGRRGRLRLLRQPPLPRPNQEK